jgi:hypothetical protein
MVTVSVALCATDWSISLDAECTCPHPGDHATCPMHHPAPKSNSKSDCSCRGTADPPFELVEAVVGPTAVVPDRIVFAAPFTPSSFDASHTPQLLSVVLTPDGPPPRS